LVNALNDQKSLAYFLGLRNTGWIFSISIFQQF